MKRFHAAAKAAAAGLVLAAAASLWLAFWPGFYRGFAAESTPPSSSPATAPRQPASMTHEFSQSLLEHNGLKALPLLVFPVGIAFIALLTALWRDVSGSRVILWVNAVLLGAFSLVALFSIGIFYLPAAAALMTAAVVNQWSVPAFHTRQQRRRTSRERR